VVCGEARRPPASNHTDAGAFGVFALWQVLKRIDIARVTQDLEQRRVETLRRHAGEIEAIEAERVELEALSRLTAAFADKFKKGTAPTASPMPAAVAPVVAAPVERRSEPATRKDQQRGRHLSNFNMFIRTMPQPDCC
jgi:hypothetical protein